MINGHEHILGIIYVGRYDDNVMALNLKFEDLEKTTCVLSAIFASILYFVTVFFNCRAVIMWSPWSKLHADIKFVHVGWPKEIEIYIKTRTGAQSATRYGLIGVICTNEPRFIVF